MLPCTIEGRQPLYSVSCGQRDPHLLLLGQLRGEALALVANGRDLYLQLLCFRFQLLQSSMIPDAGALWKCSTCKRARLIGSRQQSTQGHSDITQSLFRLCLAC